MSEFQGNKFVTVNYHDDYFSDEYVDWLEDRIEVLTNSNASLRKQLEAFHRQSIRNYSFRDDYVPYPEEDRDR